MDMIELLRHTEATLLFFRDLESKYSYKFAKAGITRCGHCNASGLAHGNDINQSCKHCMGIGYVGFKEMNEETICPDCNSSGFQLEYQNHVTDCKTCEGSGRLDWVTAIRKGVDITKLW